MPTLTRERAMLAHTTLAPFMNAMFPSRAQPLDVWRQQFRALGPFHLTVQVTVAPAARYETRQAFEDFTDLTTPTPTALYRAASERGSHGLSWTPEFPIVQSIAATRNQGCEIWETTDPSHVYGLIDVHRTWATHDGSTPDVEHLPIWIIDPGTTRTVDRWNDPTLVPVAAPEWDDRGTTRDEALAILRAWAAFNPLDMSPEENLGRDHWREQFTRIGQFTATAPESGGLEIAPTSNLTPGTLYRTAVDDRADGLAWTDSLTAARAYQQVREPHARIWTADAAHTYGRLLWHGLEAGEPYWEYIVEPTNIRRHRADRGRRLRPCPIPPLDLPTGTRRGGLSQLLPCGEPES